MPPKVVQCMVRNPLRTPIHRSAWNMNSANFTFWGFSEVLALSWCTEVFCALAHIHLPHTGVCSSRYVAS
jgi:hypothetical protein